jgi:hypothetical protein
VATSADVGVGNVSVFGRDNGGVDVDIEEAREAAPDVTRVVLDAEVGLGEVRVHDLKGELDLHNGRFGPYDDDDFAGTRDEDAVCEGSETSASG